MALSVDQVRRDTPGVEHVVHLNNAGCALPPQPVLDAQVDYLRTEACVGGYERARQLEASGVDPYARLAEYLGADPGEIGLAQSATDAWRRVLFALPLPPQPVVAFDESIYGSNLLALLYARRRFGWQLRPLRLDGRGRLDLDEAAGVLKAERVDLVALTHMAAQSGAVNPVAEVARLAHDAGASLLVDACQTLGQVPFDVTAGPIDALVFTGRKYLRGPRGTGGFYLSRRLGPLDPVAPDIRGAEVLDEEMNWGLLPQGRHLEHWERSWAGVAGLTSAIEYLADLDATWIWDRIRSLATSLVEELRQVPGVVVRRRADEEGGIVVFDVLGQDLIWVRDELRRLGVNVMFAGPQNAPIEMFRRKERGWLRASVHYFNVDDDLVALGDALRRCLGPRS